MKTSQVKKLSTKHRFLYWIKERELIRKKKESEEDKPWTDDEILMNYSFCNVIRMDDKVSRWLMKNWYEPNHGHKNMFLACLVARHFNSIETLEAMGFPKVWRPQVFLERISLLEKKFNGAYILTAMKGWNKAEMVFKVTAQQFRDRPISIDINSMQNTVESLILFKNLGLFMAGQITADLRWSMDGEWSDKNSWAPMGPGSKRGINRLNERDIKSSINQDRFLEELRHDVIETFQTEIPENLATRMEAIDWQNCLCEFDKYERKLHGEGNPKRKYPGSR